ncbi:MAG: beta-lactamase family protein [Candidatus Eremiobacteraeota bacterium]|nr:beta-lactamase family protein [Candidatus Eremiobacteraeota bacterium]
MSKHIGLSLLVSLSMVALGCQSASPPPAQQTATSQAPQATLTAAQATAIDALVRKAVRDQHVAGASLGIGINGVAVFARGYGYRDLARRLPATPTTVYNIASMSKQFAAASILLLQQEHKLNVDDHVSKYLPGFAHGDEITVRQVLNHTSGLSDYLDQLPNNALTPSMVRATVYKLQLRFPPGTKYEYSNSNYIVAGLIVEKASGMSYDSFVRTRIIVPPGLKQTTVGTSPLSLPQGSIGYTVVKGKTVPVDPRADSATVLDFPDGCVNSTVLDLITWDDALDTGRVIDHDMLELMFTPSPYKGGDWPKGYGLGVGFDSVAGHFEVAHTGGWTGFTGENATLPRDRIAVVLLTNTDTFNYGGKRDLVQQILATVVAGRASANI